MPSTAEKDQKQPYEGFPDLEPVMSHIRARREDQPAEKQALLDKWLQQLETIDDEMRKLEKIERFSLAIRPNHS